MVDGGRALPRLTMGRDVASRVEVGLEDGLSLHAGVEEGQQVRRDGRLCLHLARIKLQYIFSNWSWSDDRSLE